MTNKQDGVKELADAKGGLVPLDVEKVAKEMWLNSENFKTKLYGIKEGQYNAVTFREFMVLARIVCSKFGTAPSKDAGKETV